jgi:DNA-binding MarR family transcriptional regulator
MEALSARLGHLGIERHFFLLLAIGKGKGRLNQQELAALLDTDKVSMVGILDYLAARGFVKRVSNHADRRQRRIVLTPKALRALPEIRRVISELNRKAMAPLPEGLAEHFPEALARMRIELRRAAASARLDATGSGGSGTAPKRPTPRLPA